MNDRTKISTIVGGLPVGGNPGDVLVQTGEGTFAWASPVEALTGAVIEEEGAGGEVVVGGISDGTASPTRVNVGPEADGWKPIDYYWEDPLPQLHITRQTLPGGDAVAVEALESNNLALNAPAGFDVWIQGVKWGDVTTKLGTINSGAQVNWVSLNAATEASPEVDFAGGVALPLQTQSLADAIQTGAFTKVSSEKRSYSPADLVKVVRDFTPPAWNDTDEANGYTGVPRTFTEDDLKAIGQKYTGTVPLQNRGLMAGRVHMLQEYSAATSSAVWNSQRALHSSSTLPDGVQFKAEGDQDFGVGVPDLDTAFIDWNKAHMIINRSIIPNPEDWVFMFRTRNHQGNDQSVNIVDRGYSNPESSGFQRYYYITIAWSHWTLGFGGEDNWNIEFTGMDLSQLTLWDGMTVQDPTGL